MADMPSSKLLDSFKSAEDEAALVSVLRGYKNQIIGNKHKKAEFQGEGIVPAVIQLASEHESYAVWQQISAILYSMAAGGGSEAVQSIQDAHGPDMLLQMLSANGEGSEQVVLGAARALTALYDVCRPLKLVLLSIAFFCNPVSLLHHLPWPNFNNSAIGCYENFNHAACQLVRCLRNLI